MSSPSLDRKIIGFDLDGVIIDHSLNKIRFSKQFGFNLKPEETPSQIFKEKIPENIYREIQELFYYPKDSANFSPLMVGALEGLRKVKSSGIGYFLISRRRHHEKSVKQLQYYGLWPVFFNPNNAFFVADGEAKNTLSKKLGITHYVDDEIRILEKLRTVNFKFLFDPLNVFPNSNNYHKIQSWEQLLNHFCDRKDC